MLVYCDVYDCKHNEDGMCGNKWPIGTEAIRLSENYMESLSARTLKMQRRASDVKRRL